MGVGAVAGVPSFASAGCSAVTPQSLGPSGSSGPEGDAAGSGSGGVDGASACTPADVSAYAPDPYAPADTPSAACLGADGGGLWDAYYDACLGPGKTSDGCSAFSATPANAACASCILTSYATSRLGPIIDYGDFVGGNIAGCIQLESNDVPCAKAVQALTECEIAACQANCPVSDETSLTARESCGTDADHAGCQSFAMAATTCQAAEADAGTAGPCGNGSFKAFFDAVVPLFCGRSPAVFDGGPVGAGGDAAGAAPEDASAPADAAETDATPPDLAGDAAAE
jgi:hypothetical protein